MQYAGSELIEVGIQIEINGKAFYDEIASKTGNEKARKLFLFLAQEEKRHIEAFEKMLKSVSEYKPQEAYTDDYFNYMRSLAGNHIFTEKDKGSEVAKEVKSEREALDLGLKFENDSVKFYEGMKKAVNEKDSKIVDWLITEEKKHIDLLLEARKEILQSK
jgi:rubrerythrin